MKYVGAYAAVMGGIDVLTFTAGVGENSYPIRQEVADALGFLGLAVDPAKNSVRSKEPRSISPDGHEARSSWWCPPTRSWPSPASRSPRSPDPPPLWMWGS